MPGDGGCDHGPGVFELHAGHGAGLAAEPAGVHQEDLGAGLVQLLAQHLGVDRGRPGEEGLAEQGGEGGDRLLDAALRAGQLAGVAGDEVVHGRVLIQTGDGRQHAEGVGRQEDDGLGQAAHAGDGGGGDVVHRVADSGVLGEAAVEVIGMARLVQDHVLHHRAEADGAVDLRLLLLLQTDALGVAAALDVEHALVGPAVLVVADQRPVRVGGQGGLAGAAEAEEHGGVSVLADVGRAVHGQDALGGEDVVHDGEDGLLDLAGVLAAGDEHLVLLQVHQDGGLAVGAVHLGNAQEAGGHDQGVVRRIVLQLLRRGTDQQLVNKQVLAGQLIDDAEAAGIFGIGAAEAVEYEQLFALQVGQHLALDGVVFFLGDGHVHLAPGNAVVDGGGVHKEFVVGAAAGVFAGADSQGAVLGQNALAPLQGLFHQTGHGKIPVHGAVTGDAKAHGTQFFHFCALLFSGADSGFSAVRACGSRHFYYSGLLT